MAGGGANRAWYPADPAEQDLLTWCERAELLGEAPAADLGMAYRKLAERERVAGRYAAALAALRDWAAALAGDGREARLGRSYVEEHFLLGRDADGEVAAAAFAEGDRVASTVTWLPFVVLAAAADAAANVGAEDRAAAYAALRDAERARIDAMG